MNKIVTLNSGTPLLLSQNTNMRSVSVGICCKAGSANEDYYNDGISHLIEHLLFKGSKKRTGMEISQAIDNVGGELNAFTSREFTLFYATVLDKDAHIAIDVLSDLVLNPNFNQAALSQEKLIIKEEIMMYQELSEDFVNEENIRNLFKGSSLERSVLGRVESIDSITLEDVKKYYNQFYCAENFIISVSGNFDENQIIDYFENNWNAMQQNALPSIYMQDDPSHSNLLLGKDISQVHLCVNLDGSSYSSRDYYPLQLVSHILAAGTSSRMFKEIREKRGLAYSLYSYLSSYRNTGFFTTYVATSYKNYKDVISVIYDEFFDLSSNIIAEEELNKAKNQIIASIIFESENSKLEMLRNMNEYYSHGTTRSADSLTEQIQQVKPIDIMDVSKRKFKNRSFTALGRF